MDELAGADVQNSPQSETGEKNSCANSTVSSECSLDLKNQVDLLDNESGKRKDLENLLIKKFNTTSSNILENVTKSSESDKINRSYEDYDERERTPEEDYDDHNDMSDNSKNSSSQNIDLKIMDENDSSVNENGLKDFKTTETLYVNNCSNRANEFDSMSKIDQENDLKALNDYIRANATFEFEKLVIYLENNPHISEDQIYAKAEAENQESVRAIVEVCRKKFPELRYKINKSVKSAFKEKYRSALKHFAINRHDSRNKAYHSAKAADSSFNRNISFRDYKTKNLMHVYENQNGNHNTYEPQNISPPPKDGTNSQKHTVSQNSDHKPYKKHKSGLYASQVNDHQDPADHKSKSSSLNKNHSSPSLKSNTPNSSALQFNFSPSNLSASLSTIPNIFNTSLSQTKASASLNSTMPLFDSDPNALKSQLFDGDFMRLAATNPLFRFSDFATMANNPYFKNLFRSQTGMNGSVIPNSLSSPSHSPFGMNNLHASPSSASSSSFSSPSMTPSATSAVSPMCLSVNSLASNSQSTQSSSSLQNSSSSKKVSVPTPNAKGNNNHLSHHNHNQEKISNHSEITNQNKHTNNTNFKIQNNNEEVNNLNRLTDTSNIDSYFSASSKLKLSNKFSKLSPSEVQTIKSLITGYKESAAFLNRSAEELEALINHSYEA